MTQRASLSFDIKKKRERKGNEIQREMKNKCDLISIFIFSWNELSFWQIIFSLNRLIFNNI